MNMIAIDNISMDFCDRTRLCDGNMVGYSRIIEQSGICLITFNLIDNNVLNFLGELSHQ